MRTSGRGALIGGITRNVVLLGFVSLFTDLSSQMVFPLLPLFLTSVLGAGAVAVGVVEGAAETAASLLKVVSGRWSDRVRRRMPFVIFGYSLSSLMKPLFGLASSWPFVLTVRVAERIGKGVRSAPRDAVVAESTDAAVLGKAYGFHRAMDGVGSIAGATAAFILLPILGYRRIFWFSVLPGLAAVLFALFVRERRVGRDGTSGSGGEPVERSEGDGRRAGVVAPVRLPLRLKLFIAAAAVFALGQFGYAFMLLRAKTIGLADERALKLYTIFYVAYTLFAVPAGMLSDRVGRKQVLAAGYVLHAALCAGLIALTSPGGVLALFVVYGVFFGMIDGVQRAYVAELAPAGERATALGWFHTAVGLAALPGGYAAGLLWDRIRPEATFAYGIVMTFCALVLLCFVGRRPFETQA